MNHLKFFERMITPVVHDLDERARENRRFSLALSSKSCTTGVIIFGAKFGVTHNHLPAKLSIYQEKVPIYLDT